MNKELSGKLLGARVLVKEKKQEQKVGGVMLPGKEKQPTYTGTAIKVGEGALLNDGTVVPVQVQPGDIVYFTKFSGFELELEDGNSYLVLNERDIIYVRPATEEEK